MLTALSSAGTADFGTQFAHFFIESTIARKQLYAECADFKTIAAELNAFRMFFGTL